MRSQDRSSLRDLIAVGGASTLLSSCDGLVSSGLAPLWWRGIGSFGTGFFELSRAYEVEGGVPPDGIVEPVNVAANGLVGFLAGVEDGPPDELGFQGLEERFHHGVVVAISLAGH